MHIIFRYTLFNLHGNIRILWGYKEGILVPVYNGTTYCRSCKVILLNITCLIPDVMPVLYERHIARKAIKLMYIDMFALMCSLSSFDQLVFKFFFYSVQSHQYWWVIPHYLHETFNEFIKRSFLLSIFNWDFDCRDLCFVLTACIILVYVLQCNDSWKLETIALGWKGKLC